MSTKMQTKNLDFYYGKTQALSGINLDVSTGLITALIGPSGCGKTTFLRCLNRMNDLIPKTRLEGEVLLEGKDIYKDNIDPVEVRRRVGMVFQEPNPFPKPIEENVTYGPRIKDDISGEGAEELVEECLKDANLWEQVEDRLDRPGVELSEGQQQRLCIARAISTNPEVLLMDEPCSALDPVSTEKIENLLSDLKKKHAILVVTHNLTQARRIADRTAFFYKGDLVETGDTNDLFEDPQEELTQQYIAGDFG